MIVAATSLHVTLLLMSTIVLLATSMASYVTSNQIILILQEAMKECHWENLLRAPCSVKITFQHSPQYITNLLKDFTSHRKMVIIVLMFHPTPVPKYHQAPAILPLKLEIYLL